MCLPIPLLAAGEDPPKPVVSEMGRTHDDAPSETRFPELLDPCRHKLYNYIRKSLNFSAEADDVFQETVLRAIQYQKSFRPNGDFSAWIFGIAHNEIRKYLRSARRLAQADDIEKLPAPETAQAGELTREVFRYAERLKPKPREVFFLFYNSGFSVAEISSITGLRQGNVRFILNQARASLKTLLGEDHD